jgi:flagellar hook-associated protein 3 FlgL
MPAPIFSTPATGASTTINANAPGLDLGWEVTIAGVPAANDRFQVSSTEKQSIFDTLQGITDGVANLTDSGADKAALVDLVSDTLANLQYAEKHINQARAFVGASLNTVEVVRDSQQGIELVNEAVLSEIRDLDMAEAISRLKLESLALEASQQSFSRITRLSLFDFL